MGGVGGSILLFLYSGGGRVAPCGLRDTQCVGGVPSVAAPGFKITRGRAPPKPALS